MRTRTTSLSGSSIALDCRGGLVLGQAMQNKPWLDLGLKPTRTKLKITSPSLRFSDFNFLSHSLRYL